MLVGILLVSAPTAAQNPAATPLDGQATCS
jgi:hypothetical protein